MLPRLLDVASSGCQSIRVFNLSYASLFLGGHFWALKMNLREKHIYHSGLHWLIPMPSREGSLDF